MKVAVLLASCVAFASARGAFKSLDGNVVFNVDQDKTISFSVGLNEPVNILGALDDIKKLQGDDKTELLNTIQNVDSSTATRVAQLKNSTETGFALARNETINLLSKTKDDIQEVIDTKLPALEARVTEMAGKVKLTSKIDKCIAENTGVMSVLKEDACQWIKYCDGKAWQRLQLVSGPAEGSAKCNPLDSCPKNTNGNYWIGDEEVVCHNGEAIGDGSKTNPSSSCELLFKYYPEKKKAGIRTYYFTADSDSYDFSKPTNRVTENRPVRCKVGEVVRYGVKLGNSGHYSYRVMDTQPIRCVNGIFGDPKPGRGKACDCGKLVHLKVHQRRCNPGRNDKPDARIQLNGLVGWWKAEDYNQAAHPDKWHSINPRDYFGKNSPVIDPQVAYATIAGRPLQIDQGLSANGASIHMGLSGHTYGTSNDNLVVPHVDGYPATTIHFSPMLQHNFALCSITRWTRGDRTGKYGRVLVSDEGNFLHGHWNYRAGVAYWDNWLNWNNKLDRHAYVVLCGSRGNGGKLYGNNGQRWTTRNSVSGSKRHVGIGTGPSTEYSFYAISELMMWNKGLNEKDLANAAKYLTAKVAGSA